MRVPGPPDDGGRTSAASEANRDRLGVANARDAARMTYLLLCPWCEEEAPFDGELDDQLTCLGCGLRIELTSESARVELPLPQAA